jgi:hypothetical protein
MTAKQHLAGIEATIGKPVDAVVINTEPIPKETLTVYANEEEYPVVDDLQNDPRVIRASVISDSLHTPVAYDTAHRSLLRHDNKKLEKVLAALLPG